MMKFLGIIQKYIMLTLIGEHTIVYDIGNSIVHHNLKMVLHLISLFFITPFESIFWCLHDSISNCPLMVGILTIVIIVAIVKIRKKTVLKRKLAK